VKDPEDQMYVPFAQDRIFGGVAGVIRAGGDPSALVRAIPRAVAEIDPGVAVSEARPLARDFAEDVAEPRFRSVLVGAFAAAALLLAAVGLYGVVAYAVARRRFEIGIRIALGATPEEIRRHFVGNALLLAGAGALAGALAAIPAARAMSEFLFGLSAANPLAFAAAAGLLLAVAAVAADVPSRRASRTDPLVALRSE
jgi:putative ABC transport system permease protein